MSDIDSKIQGVFDKALEKGGDDDSIRYALVSAGIKFGRVNALFNELMVGGGHRLSKDQKDELVQSNCEGSDLGDEETFNNAVKGVSDASDSITERSAIALIRSWAQKAKVDCFKKPRGGGGQGRAGFASKFYAFLTANPLSADEDVEHYIATQPDRPEGSDVSKNVIKHKSHYKGIANLVKTIASK